MRAPFLCADAASSVQVVSQTSAGKVDNKIPVATLAPALAHEMFTIILSGVSPHDLKTAALNQLIHLSASNVAAQVCHGI